MTARNRMAPERFLHHAAMAFFLLALSLPSVSRALPPNDGDRDLRYDFDGFGRKTIDPTADLDGSALAVACGPDGTCYAVSTSEMGGDDDFRVRRFSPTGGFVSEAAAAFQLGGVSHDEPSAVAVQADGRVVVAGYATDAGPAGDDQQVALARFVPGVTTMTLDSSFSGDGKVTQNFNGLAEARAVAIGPGGEIVTVGCYLASGPANFDILVMRFSPSGVPDTTFDGNGVVTLGIDGGGNDDDCAQGVIVQPDGKIVVVGESEMLSPNSQMIVFRLTASGALDSTFAGDGIFELVLDASPGAFNSAASVTLDHLRRIVVGGGIGGAGPSRSVILRLTSAGTLDSFAVNGHFIGASGSSLASNIAVAGPPSNRIFYSNGDSIGALTGAGVVDTSFSGDGFVPFDDPVGTDEALTSMALAAGEPRAAGLSAFGATQYEVIGTYFMHQIFGDDFEGGTTAAWKGW
ncbi:MAG: hypothetical protein ABI639_06175 [Thermoanaerobaculia bacterium]